MKNPVVHFEIGCRDSEKTRKFYSKVFGWNISKNAFSLDIDTNSEKGIQGHITSLGHEPHNYITFYIEVDDMDKYLESIKEEGGEVVVGPVALPTGERFAWFKDMDGNIVGIATPKV
ncbi:MAG: VOC family protein [Bacteroidota bacterium]